MNKTHNPLTDKRWRSSTDGQKCLFLLYPPSSSSVAGRVWESSFDPTRQNIPMSCDDSISDVSQTVVNEHCDSCPIVPSIRLEPQINKLSPTKNYIKQAIKQWK